MEGFDQVDFRRKRWVAVDEGERGFEEGWMKGGRRRPRVARMEGGQRWIAERR